MPSTDFHEALWTELIVRHWTEDVGHYAPSDDQWTAIHSLVTPGRRDVGEVVAAARKILGPPPPQTPIAERN